MKNGIVLAITSIMLCLYITCSYQTPIMAYDDVEVKPVPTSLPKPEYPEIAKESNVKGSVVVKALVDEHGKIQEAQVYESGGSELLDNAALEAVMLAEFKPASHQGKPVRVWVMIPFKFEYRECIPEETDDESNVMPYHMVEKTPRPIDLVTPEYPEQARKNGIEGRTVVRALIDFDGHICETEVTSSSGNEMLDNAALSAVKKSIFDPASHEGKPVKVWVSIPIQFKLSG